MTSVVVLVPRARSGRKSKMETNEASAIKKTKPKATNSKRKGGKYCVAGGPDNIGCKNNSHTPGVSMHDFPKDEKTRKKWIDFVRRHRHGWKPNSDARTPPSLCSLHFEPTCFNRNISINLGDSEPAKPLRRYIMKGQIPTIDKVAPSPEVQTPTRREVRQVSATAVNSLRHVTLLYNLRPVIRSLTSKFIIFSALFTFHYIQLVRHVLSPAAVGSSTRSSTCEEMACSTPEVETDDEVAPVERNTFPEQLMSTTPTSSKVELKVAPTCFAFS